MPAKKTSPLHPSHISIVAAQKSSGKTTLAVFIADALSLCGVPVAVFQIDDQERLQTMVGEVTNLRPNPDEVIEDPTVLTRALDPFYEAARTAAESGTCLLLDTGANEVETLANYLRDVEFDSDAQDWGVPIVVYVPFLPLDPESTAQSAFTVRRLAAVLPSARIVLVENRFGGSVARIVPGSLAEASYRDLVKAAKGAEHIVMPGIPREYWSPFEGAGVRFVKALAMEPAAGSRALGRSIGEFKVMRSAVARFWRQMHAQVSQIIALPKGGQ